MLVSPYGDGKSVWCRKDMMCQTSNEARTSGNWVQGVTTLSMGQLHIRSILLKTWCTHTHKLSEAWDKNQGLFNGAHETSKVWEYQQKCRTLILPGHKVTREEAADDRQLNWKGRHLLGIRCLFILSTKNDVLSSKYASYWRYNEGFPKAERHVKEGVSKGQHTEQSRRGGMSLFLADRWIRWKVAGKLLTGTLPPPVSLLASPWAYNASLPELQSHGLSMCGRTEPLAGEAAAAEPWESSSTPGRAAALTHKGRPVNRLPFPQSLQCFSKRINGQAVLRKAKSKEEHCAPMLLSLVITRGKNRNLEVRDKAICWNQHSCGERLKKMLALLHYLHPHIIYLTSSRMKDWYEYSRCY